MTAFRMPSLGADMDEGTLVEWIKKPGDQLKRGDIIAVVETQKGAIEIEVFHDGVLEAIHVKTGSRVPVGEVLATIRTAEEPESAQPVPPEVVTQKPVYAPPAQVAAPFTPGLKITPAASSRAKELGIDVQSVFPGQDGIIGLKEIEVPSVPAKPKASRGINLDEMRNAIAAAMARSKREIPHYYVSSIIDMTAMMEWLATENARRTVSDRLLAAVPIIKACALGLQQVPELNGHFLDDRPLRIAEVKMGIGIALRGGGLIAPALALPDRLSLTEIMQRLSDLVARVRGGRLRSSELTEATVTLSNLGDNSADMVLPVIYPPQVAIIGVGQIDARPWVVDGTLASRKIATFAVAGDHRANDGRSAARFLRLLGEILQKPEML
ncbi:MAG: dihydrolipoamide acetyltransferase family protein [Aestuariivirga sp.]|nr:dihydrolipoamide acetyltransferase family protein [Aestuariivirga sp.]